MKKIGLTVTMIALAAGVFAQQQTYNHRAMQAQKQEEEAQEQEERIPQDKAVSQAYKTPSSSAQPVAPSEPDEEEIIIEEDNYGYDEDDVEDNMSPEDDDEDGPQTE